MLASHGRFAYSPITARPDFTWPGGKRLALYVAVCVEHFPYNEGGLGLPYSPGLQHPNTYNWAWREYGNRVGGFRLADTLAASGIRPGVLLNTECYEHCPELVAAYRALGGELVGHGLGRKLHEDPQVPNYGKAGSGKTLQDGMVLAIEPMINMGTHRVRQLKDGWSIITADGKPSAHFEHNVALVEGRPVVLSSFEPIYQALGIANNDPIFE